MAANTTGRCCLLCQVDCQTESGKFELKNYSRETLIHTIVFVPGQDKVIVLRNGLVQGVVQSPEPVTHGQLWEHQESGHFMFWCSTVTGKLYCIQLWPPRDQIKTRQSKGENGSESGERDSPCIFEDLLGNCDEREQPSYSSPEIFTIRDEHFVLQTALGDSLLLLSDCLVLLLPLASGYCLSVFPVQYNSQSADIRVDSVPVKSFHLPDRGVTSNFTYEEQKNVKTNAVSVNSCVLFTVYPEGSEHSEHHLDDLQSSVLGKKLYNGLFGLDMNLINVRIILVGLRSGKIYSVPLVSDYQTSRGQPSILYDLQQPVIGIHGSRVSLNKKAAPPGGHESLCFIGSVGKLAIIHAQEASDKENSLGWSSREFHIAGPIVDSAMSSNHLLHSTGQEVHSTDLSALLDQSTQSYLSSKTHITASVVALETCSPSRGNVNLPGSASTGATRNLEIMLVTSQGRVMKYDLSVEADWPSTPGVAKSQMVKDLMTSIANSSEQLDKMNKQLVEEDHILGQLSIAGYISSLSGGQEKNTQCKSKPPFSINTAVTCQDLGQKVEYTLVVCLTNDSPVKLSQDWTLVVSIAAQDRKQGLKSSTTFRLNPLSPGQFEKFLFPLEQSQLNSLPLVVQPSMIYSYRCKTEGSDQGRSLTIPLSVALIDMLYFLRPLRPGNPPVSCGSMERGVAATLHHLAAQRPFGESYLAQHETPQVPTNTSHTCVTIHVSKHRITDLIGKSTDKGLEVALMNFLLQNSSIQPNLQQAHVRADFFGGHQVSLAIQRAPGSAGDLQVSLQSPTVGVMCQLRAAVLSQLKTRDVNNSAPVTCKAVRGQLAQSKDVLSDAEALQEAAEAKSITLAQLADQTLKLYQKLRSVHIFH